MVATLLAALTSAGCTSDGSQAPHAPSGGADNPPGAASSAAAANQDCRTDVTPRALPSWATAGFDPPTQPMPYVLSDTGDLVAILWSAHDPLSAPPRADRNNKILWVSRTWGAPLQINATLTGSGRTARRTVAGGPGPSIVDLPAPGCWSLDLTWGEHHDHLRLEYATS